jgi:glyoxylase-like metal-dependent hydrolase (beta-lactamase superfamily II)
VLRVVRVLAANPGIYTLEGTNTWVVGEDPSIVIDPGPDDEEHLGEVARAAGEVGLVLVTHDHPDHAPGAVRFARAATAPVRGWRLSDGLRVRDGETFHVGRVTITALHTPGHTADHVAFWIQAAGALFTGDAVLGRGTSFIDPPEGDLARYLRSLERMRDIGPRVLYPGHGPVVFGADAKLREYLEHRREREQQVLRAFASPRTIADAVEEIYTDYPPEVHPLAARSVLAHLIKLENEGRVRRRGKGDVATWETTEPAACARCGRPVAGRGRYCSNCSLILLQEGAASVREEASEEESAEEEPRDEGAAEEGPVADATEPD